MFWANVAWLIAGLVAILYQLVSTESILQLLRTLGLYYGIGKLPPTSHIPEHSPNPSFGLLVVNAAQAQPMLELSDFS